MDYYIAHHGVKGMKWGVRRQRRLNKKSIKTLNKISADVKRSQKQQKKKKPAAKTPTYEELLAQQRQKQRQREAAIATTFGKTNEYVESQISRSFDSLVAGPLVQQQMKTNFYSWLND